MRVVLLTGKGGVGKTSLAAATALCAAEHGHRVFLLSTDSAHSLGDVLGQPVGAQPLAVAERVVAQEVDVLAELERSWSDIRGWLRELLREEVDEILAEELLVFPGLEELIALRAVRVVEEAGESDLCVVDCAPTGATLRMLRFPDALRIFMQHFFDLKRRVVRGVRPVMERLNAGRWVPPEAFYDAFERLYADVEDVRRILLDGERTSARLVVNPARVVVEEARRSFAYLSLYGVATDAVVVNRLLPDGACNGYFARWKEREGIELDEIRESFPLPILGAPLRPGEVIGVEALRELGRDVYRERDPAQRFADGRPIRLEQRAGRARLEIDLPGASKEEVEVGQHGSDLVVRVRDAERLIALPEALVGLAVASARLRDGVLEVVFRR